MKDNIDKSLVSEHIGETVNIGGMEFKIESLGSIEYENWVIILSSEQTKLYYMADPKVKLCDACDFLWDVLKRNGEVYSCIPYELSAIEDVPACYKAALKYMSIEYYGESSSEVDVLLDLINEFANKHKDRTLTKIVNSYSTGLKYNCITKKVIDD